MRHSFGDPVVALAAGGNATLLLSASVPRHRRSAEAALIVAARPDASIEQIGFVDIDAAHLEMFDGELCMNATRSAAAVLAAVHGDEFEMTTSGHSSPVAAVVGRLADDDYWVDCRVDDFDVTVRAEVLDESVVAHVVTMPGITHVLVAGSPLPRDEQITMHREAEAGLELGDVPALGVIRFDAGADPTICPVVRSAVGKAPVPETACGSGSIAAAVVTGREHITQPTGEVIRISITGRSVTSSSSIRLAPLDA